MIKLTYKIVTFSAISAVLVGILSLYTVSTSNVPNILNNHLMHQVVKPLFRSTSTNQRNATVRPAKRYKLPGKLEVVRLSNRKRDLMMQTSVTVDKTATQADEKENEVTSQAESPGRSLISVNGAIDSRKYSNEELDRLYGDALLVYVKNFNDTLPSRKDVKYVNGTRVPIFQSRPIRVRS